MGKLSIFDTFFQTAVAATVFQLSSQNQDHQFFKSKKVEGCFWHFPKVSLLRGVIWRPREEHFGRTPCIYIYTIPHLKALRFSQC